jgi:hypothetical protein
MVPPGHIGDRRTVLAVPERIVHQEEGIRHHFQPPDSLSQLVQEIGALAGIIDER